MKRLTAGLAGLVGLVLILVAVFQNLFAVGPAFEEMIDDFRPYLADEPIAALRADIAMLSDAVEEFQTTMAPALAEQLEMDAGAFQAMMADQFPAVATGMAVVPEAAPTFAGIVDLLDEQQANFASADAIPSTSLPATTVPWGILLVGLAFVVIGVFMFRAASRTPALVAIGVGVLVVIGALALSLPGKSGDADALNEALKPVYTEETISGASQAVEAIGAMGAEMQGTMLPGLAGMLGMTEPEVEAFLGGNFPAVAAALGAMPEALPRFEAVVQTFDTNLDNYETLRPVAFSPIIWTVMIGAVIVAAAGGVALFNRRDVE